jgi:tetratricopeptide (TPR) repeat protein
MVNKRFVLVIILFVAVSFGGDIRVSSDDTATADAAFDSKQFKLAKDLYRQAYINATAGSDTSRYMFGIAKSDYRLKNYYEAAINLKRFFQLYPNSALANDAHLLLGLCFVQTQKYAEAEEQFDLVQGELDEKANIARAEIALLKNDTEKAEKLLDKIDRRTYDNDNRVLYLRAMILSKNNKHKEAIEVINKIPEAGLKEEGISVSKAIIYYNARKFIDAMDMLIKIVKDPSSRIEEIQAKRTIFQINDYENNEDETLKLALELLDYEATDEMKLKVVSIYEKRGDTANVFRFLITLRDKQLLSDKVEVKLKKSIADKDPKADEYLAKYYTYLSTEIRYNFELSAYATSRGNNDLARRMLQRMLKGKLGTEASIALGEMLVTEKRYAEARKIVQPVLTDPNYAGQAALIMAQIALREGDEAEAAVYRIRAIRVLEIQRDYYRVGEVYMMTGNKAEALKNYAKAADKGDVMAMIKAADLFYLTGKSDRAKFYYKKAIDKGISDSKAEQWADYQYGKLAKNDEYLDKAKAGGGFVGQAAELINSSR